MHFTTYHTMNFYDFILKMAADHPILSFMILLGIYGIAGLIFRIINRLLRTINVTTRGWPPEHLDADGDWKPESETITDPEGARDRWRPESQKT